GRIDLRPGGSFFGNALNFCRSAIAALVRSPCRYCPFRSPGGPPLPLAPSCNRQRPFFVAATGRPSRFWSALRTAGLSEIARVVGFLVRLHCKGAKLTARQQRTTLTEASPPFSDGTL